MTNIIYTYGAGEALNNIFNGIAMIFDSGLASEMLLLLASLGELLKV